MIVYDKLSIIVQVQLLTMKSYAVSKIKELSLKYLSNFNLLLLADAGNLLKGEEKRKFDEIAQNLQDERFKFLVILNALRRDAKPLSADTEAFYTYRYDLIFIWLDWSINCIISIDKTAENSRNIP